jgi:hypothetical protein
MKKPINEIAKLKRLAGLITESEYQESLTNEYHQDAINIEKVKETKTPVSKDKKIQVIKEWIWYTCDEGQVKDDINKYNKMVDMYFADKDDVTKEDFKKIWNKVTEKWGVDDVGADSEAFPETWRDVQTGNLVNPDKVYEVKEKVEEVNSTELKLKGYYQILDAGTNEWNNDYQYIGKVGGGSSAGEVGEHMFAATEAPGSFAFVSIPDADLDAMVKSSMSEGKEKVEEVSGEAFKRMNSLVNRNHILSLLAAAEGIMGDLEADGFDAEDIHDYINQIIVNDI